MVTKISRKESRKAARKLKKAKKLSFASKKPLKDVLSTAGVVLPTSKNSQKTIRNNKNRKKEHNSTAADEMTKHTVQVEIVRRKQQRILARTDEKEAKRFARKLGLNRRRNKSSLPQSFIDSGLDYILDVCDRKKLHKDTEETERDGCCSEDEYEVAESSSDSDGEWNSGMLSDASSSGQRDATDIYGRTRDKDGNVIPLSVARFGAAKKLKELENTRSEVAATDADRSRLTKQIRGLVNKLSEQTLVASVQQVGQLFQNHSRNDVKEILSLALIQAVSMPFHLPEKLRLEYGSFLSLVHSKVSPEITAHFVEKLTVIFRDDLTSDKSESDDHSHVNQVSILSILYRFKVVTNMCILELLHYLLERFTQKEIDLILFLLTNVGFQLRKDSPAELKEFTTMVQSKVNSEYAAQLAHQDWRVRFMLETLKAIRNNNSLKINSQINQSLIEHFIKLLRGLKTSSESESALPFGFRDVLSVEENGRWWIVGSSWISSAEKPESRKDVSRFQQNMEFSQQLLKTAQKCRMNTDLRRTIFCIIMSAEDYLDAFEKLLKLRLSGQQEREIVHICVSCCLREKKFNPYYTLLLKKLCGFHRRFQLTTQYAMWDRIKELHSFKSHHRHNLASLISDLISGRSLCLSALKVIDFAELGPSSSALVRSVMMPLLVELPVEKLTEIFGKTAGSSALKLFRDGLRLFFHHVLLKSPDLSDSNKKMVEHRIEVIEKIWVTDNS